MSRRRPTLLDKAIEMIDVRIKLLQQERADLIELQASAIRPAPPKPRATLKERIDELTR